MNNKLMDCGHPASPHGEHTTGYGQTEGGKKHCWDCCAVADKKQMIETGKSVLYLIPDNRKMKVSEWSDGEVTNWPGTLNFKARVKRGFHNMTTRFDCWFKGPDGFIWHGINLGDMDIVRCKRTKEVAK